MEYQDINLINHMRKPPNQITAIRFVAVPVMWICAFLGARFYIGIGLIIGFLSDLFDGAVARKLNQTSDFGSKFDSLTDQMLQLSSIIWILILMPEIFQENVFVSLLALIIYFSSLSIGLIKFNRLANLHLYLSKFGGLFLYLFMIHAFITGQYHRGLFLVAVILFILSSAESAALQLTSSEVNTDSGSIFFRYMRTDHPIRVWLSRLP